jgi:phosphoglycerol transferase
LLDQTTSGDVLDYDAAARQWTGDAAFVHQIENTLGSDAMVFQLPIAVFPEQGSLNGMYDYAQSIGYLHSDTLRWSYGGMKGREATWQDPLRPLTAPDLLHAIATAGFDGLTIDRSAYADGGAAMIDQITPILGAPLFASEVGEQVFFDVRSYRAQVERDLGPGLAAARAAVLEVPPVLPGDGFYPTDYVLGHAQTWSPSSSDLTVDNNAGSARHYTTTFAVTAAAAGQWQLRISGDGVDEAVTITSQTSHVTLDYEAPAGRSQLHLGTNAPGDQGPDPRDLHFLIAELTTRVAA